MDCTQRTCTKAYLTRPSAALVPSATATFATGAAAFANRNVACIQPQGTRQERKYNKYSAAYIYFTEGSHCVSRLQPTFSNWTL
eukprot:365325-Chlamydomonas_euryale.AAC.5